MLIVMWMVWALEALLVTFAVARLTRLVTTDEISRPIREPAGPFPAKRQSTGLPGLLPLVRVDLGRGPGGGVLVRVVLYPVLVRALVDRYAHRGPGPVVCHRVAGARGTGGMTMAWWARKPNVTSDVGRATAVVASAARLRYDASGSSRKVTRQEWQAEAWHHYEECGELAYVVDLIAKAMSRSRLYITRLDEHGDPVESPDAAPAEVNDAFLGGPARQKELLHEVGIQLGVPGECYLIGEPERDESGAPTDRETWLIASNEELVERSGQYLLDQGDGARELPAEETVIVRVWVPSPRRHAHPEVPGPASRRVLRLIERLSQYVQCQIDSRLAGAGVLLLPNELTFVAAESEENPGDGASSFLAALTEAMTTAVK